MGEFVGDFEHNGMNRRYLFVRGSLPNAVAVVLHPFGGSAESSFAWQGASLVRHGFSTLVPEGYRNSWNAGACCGPALEQNVDDEDFLRKLVEFILREQFKSSTGNGNAVRVYVMGFSNGAFLASKLALRSTAAGKQSWISAVALQSGYSYDLDLYTRALNAGGGARISILALHGGNDLHVNVQGCCATTSPRECCCGITSPTCFPFDSSVEYWRRINRCPSVPLSSTSSAVLPFFNFSSSREPIACRAEPVCGVYSCTFAESGHFILRDAGEDAADLISAFFIQAHAPQVVVASEGAGSLPITTVESSSLPRGDALLQTVWLALGIVLALVLVWAWVKLARRGRLFALAIAAARGKELELQQQREHQNAAHAYSRVNQRLEEDVDAPAA